MLQKRCSIFFVRCCLACERTYCLHWPNGGQSVATAHLPTPALPRRWSTLASGFFVRPVGLSKVRASFSGGISPSRVAGPKKMRSKTCFPLCWNYRILLGGGGVRNVKRSLVGLRDGDVLKRGDLPRAVVVHPLSPSKADFKTLVRRVHVSPRLNGSRLTESVSK